MNYIGLKHLVLTRIEQFLFLFIKCRHRYSIQLTHEDVEILTGSIIGISKVVMCRSCDKIATVYIHREYHASELPPALYPVERKRSESGNFHD